MRRVQLTFGKVGVVFIVGGTVARIIVRRYWRRQGKLILKEQQ